MQIVLIRHFMTNGNLEKRYIGRTDEPLLANAASGIIYAAADRIYSSPMKRCIQTAKIIYGPDSEIHINESLREMDFGDFEGKNYDELKDDTEYRLFIDSGGTRKIPGGESAADFRKRSCDGFVRIIDEMLEIKAESAAIICHGGTIMSIMAEFDSEKKDFYSYMVKNGCGYWMEFDTGLKVMRKLEDLAKCE
ncbi:MAG: histidine phosphatase family protein [Saccharofermentanales bacterium]